MEINTLSTNSLYKACAMIGLTILLFNTYYATKILNDYRHQLIGLNSTLKKFNHQMEMITGDLQTIVSKMPTDSSKSKMADLSTSEKLISDYKQGKALSDEEETAVLFIAANNKLNILKTKEFQNKTVHQEISFKLLKLERYAHYLQFGAALGLFVLLFGCYNWYKNQHTLLVKVLNRKAKYSPQAPYKQVV